MMNEYRLSACGLVLTALMALLAGPLLGSPYFEANYPVALSEARSGNWQRATKIWRRCLAQTGLSKAEQTKLSFQLARAYAKLGNRRKALEMAQQAKRLAPRNAKIDKLLQKLQAAGGNFSQRFAEARASFDSALSNERLYDGSGSSLFTEAMPVFKQAISRNVEKGYAHFALGTCLLETGGDREEAKKHLEEAERASCTDVELYFRLGERALDDGDGNKAVDYLEKCDANGGAIPVHAAALVRAYAKKGGTLDKNKIVNLVTRVATANAELALGLGDDFSDSAIRNEVNKVISTARAAEQRAASSPAPRGGSSSSGTSSSSSKPTQQQAAKPKEREKTAVEKNYDKYNEMQYRNYLNHLNRLAQGKPSSWSGAIPKKPQKKKK